MNFGPALERLGPAAAGEVEALERRFREGRTGWRDHGLEAPGRGTAPDCDVLIAGGGLSLLYAIALARRGLSVVVVDPRGAGRGHREWNASEGELQALVTGGALDSLEGLIIARTSRGRVQWKGGPARWVAGVLDVSLDAQGLLDRLRARAAAAGVTFLDGEAVTTLAAGKGGCAARLVSAGASRTLVARLVVDARGAASPFARWDLICPTVGGVFRGLSHDGDVGDILVSLDGAGDGLQPIWEAFPGRPGELAVYLFEYAEPHRLGSQPLSALFERFFRDLPRYKAGIAELVRPAFGFIPGSSRLRPHPVSPGARVVLVGDAAARHSPLTYCGFGSALRSYAKVAEGLVRCLADDRLGAASLSAVWDEPSLVSAQGALALMMIDRGGLGTSGDPEVVNRLLDAAFGALEAQGDEAFRAFLQDRAGFDVLWRMLRDTARALPWIYGKALRNLNVRELCAAAFRLASFRRAVA